MINYPNCTNFKGNRICVYTNISKKEVQSLRVLDPHFSNENKGLSPYARFEPTEAGWIAAVFLAENLGAKTFE